MRFASLLILAALTLAGCATDGSTPESPAALATGCAEGSALGCANDANLRAMLADPRDLDRGVEAAPARGDAATRPAERYRQGQVQLPTMSAATPTLSVSMERE